MFECYECYLDGVLLYIGEGKRGRHAHCNSGCSHVYELNRLHFEGKVFDVKVSFFKTKEEACEQENILIKTHNPPLNVRGTIGESRGASLTKELKRKLITLAKHTRISPTRKERLLQTIDEFFYFYRSCDLKENKLMLHLPSDYSRAGLKGMHSFTSALMYRKETENGIIWLFKKLVEQACCEVYGKDHVEITFPHRLWQDSEVNSELVEQSIKGEVNEEATT